MIFLKAVKISEENFLRGSTRATPAEKYVSHFHLGVEKKLTELLQLPPSKLQKGQFLLQLRLVLISLKLELFTLKKSSVRPQI